MREIKTYTQSYFYDEEKVDCIAVQWKTGMKEFHIYHNRDLLTVHKGYTSLSKGIVVESPKMGNINIRILANPFGFEVQIGDRFLFNSKIMAEENLKTVSKAYNIFGVLSIVGAALFFILVDNQYAWIDATINVVFALLLLLSSYFVKKAYLWAYFLGLVLLFLNAILKLILGAYLPLLFTVIFIIVVLTVVKSMFTLYKHRRALDNYRKKHTSDDLLDV